jgi:hypothetical protein
MIETPCQLSRHSTAAVSVGDRPDENALAGGVAKEDAGLGYNCQQIAEEIFSGRSRCG